MKRAAMLLLGPLVVDALGAVAFAEARNLTDEVYSPTFSVDAGDWRSRARIRATSRPTSPA